MQAAVTCRIMSISSDISQTSFHHYNTKL